MRPALLPVPLALLLLAACGEPEGRRLAELGPLHFEVKYLGNDNVGPNNFEEREGERSQSGTINVRLYYGGECRISDRIRGTLNGQPMYFYAGNVMGGPVHGTGGGCDFASVSQTFGRTVGLELPDEIHAPFPERLADEEPVDAIVIEDGETTLRLEVKNVVFDRRFVVEEAPQEVFRSGDRVRMRWTPESDKVDFLVLEGGYDGITTEDGHVFEFDVPAEFRGQETHTRIKTFVHGRFDVLKCPEGATCSAEFHTDTALWPMD